MTVAIQKPGGPREAVRRLSLIMDQGLASVAADKIILDNLRLEGAILHLRDKSHDLDKFDRVICLGAGKCSGFMAMGLERVLGERLHGGLVVVKSLEGLALAKIKALGSAHPVPDRSGIKAAEELLALAGQAGKNDLVIILLSGGASALIPAPAKGLALEDKQAACRALLASGACIREVNAVRKHLSRIKGGGLARILAPATVLCLSLSDVVHNDPGVIGSGPAAPDETTYSDCLDILDKYSLREKIGRAALAHLLQGAAGKTEETVKPDDPCLGRVENLILGDNSLMLEAAAQKARELGLNPIILTSRLQGEARQAARVLAAILQDVAAGKGPVQPPACVLAGGETTVTVKGAGRGGRNQELCLALGLALEETPDLAQKIFSACLGSDGQDGETDAAGAALFPKTLNQARKSGLSPEKLLEQNDSHRLFQAAGGHIQTTPTQTNVTDLFLSIIF